MARSAAIERVIAQAAATLMNGAKPNSSGSQSRAFDEQRCGAGGRCNKWTWHHDAPPLTALYAGTLARKRCAWCVAGASRLAAGPRGGAQDVPVDSCAAAKWRHTGWHGALADAEQGGFATRDQFSSADARG